MPKDFKKQVFDHYEELDRLVKNRFQDENAADKAFLYLIEKLEEKDWKRVRNHRGDSSFRTYLLAVARRLVEDFLRKEFGRPRPPAWLKAQGTLWTEVYRRLCLERMSPRDVVRSLKIWLSQKRDASLIEEAVDVILTKIPECGKPQEKEEKIEDEDQKDTPFFPSLHYLTPEQMVTALERVSLLEAARFLLSDTEPSENNSLRNAISKLRSQVKPSGEESLFLKMVYEDGIPVSKAGKSLGWNTNQAHGRHRRLLARIGKAFKESGLEEEEMLKSVFENGNGVVSEIF